MTNDELLLELRVESGFADAHNYELRKRNDELSLELRVESGFADAHNDELILRIVNFSHF